MTWAPLPGPLGLSKNYDVPLHWTKEKLSNARDNLLAVSHTHADTTRVQAATPAMGSRCVRKRKHPVAAAAVAVGRSVAFENNLVAMLESLDAQRGRTVAHVVATRRQEALPRRDAVKQSSKRMVVLQDAAHAGAWKHGSYRQRKVLGALHRFAEKDKTIQKEEEACHQPYGLHGHLQCATLSVQQQPLDCRDPTHSSTRIVHNCRHCLNPGRANPVR